MAWAINPKLGTHILNSSRSACIDLDIKRSEVKVTQLLFTNLFNGLFSSTSWVSRQQKGKPFWILMSKRWWGSSDSWTICKSFASQSRWITMPLIHYSFFCRPDALPATEPTESKHWKHHGHMVTTTTTTVLRPFVWDYPGELVPEETFTQSHISRSSIIFISFLHLLQSISSCLFTVAWLLVKCAAVTVCCCCCRCGTARRMTA